MQSKLSAAQNIEAKEIDFYLWETQYYFLSQIFAVSAYQLYTAYKLQETDSRVTDRPALNFAFNYNYAAGHSRQLKHSEQWIESLPKDLKNLKVSDILGHLKLPAEARGKVDPSSGSTSMSDIGNCLGRIERGDRVIKAISDYKRIKDAGRPVTVRDMNESISDTLLALYLAPTLTSRHTIASGVQLRRFDFSKREDVAQLLNENKFMDFAYLRCIMPVILDLTVKQFHLRELASRYIQDVVIPRLRGWQTVARLIEGLVYVLGLFIALKK